MKSYRGLSRIFMNKKTLKVAIFVVGLTLVAGLIFSLIAYNKDDKDDSIDEVVVISDANIEEDAEEFDHAKLCEIESVLESDDFGYDLVYSSITQNSVSSILSLLEGDAKPSIKNRALTALLFLRINIRDTQTIITYISEPVNWKQFNFYEQISIYAGKSRAIRVLGTTANPEAIAILEQALRDSNYCLKLTRSWASQGEDTLLAFTEEDVVSKFKSAAAEGLIYQGKGSIVQDYLEGLMTNASIEVKSSLSSPNSASIEAIVPELISALVNNLLIQELGLPEFWRLQEVESKYSEVSQPLYFKLREDIVSRFGEFQPNIVPAW